MRNSGKKHTTESAEVSRGRRFGVLKQDSGIGVVFTGPSVEGTDNEYIKVYSGKVTDKKPSFA
ncbi:hypothetical protein [Paenibacillus sp. NEAU-GSW1]|uniref:hypothetical protein n=1 Tax=Paenibacillus sp. NEAU-GSW1 TaxID=2682486 RepID=UPI0012E1F881|nr:hypothetical protein [Paenibacillus sp. NEAU-GSW1]MUT68105.1 hypothetical protein [Paenibacillus sp. NEAU-GSW1]